MTDDAELLRRYADEHSEPAFAEFVRRHLGLVYGAALRRMDGDNHRAVEVVQHVFTKAARQAARLARHDALAGWLYTTTRNAALNQQRDEQRRRNREREAHIMNELLSAAVPEAAWNQLRPVLDEAMDELNGSDREAVLLRFFEERSFADVGIRLHLTENAARMRVERALDKLRAQLSHRGITSTSAVLGVVLANQAGVAAPASLAASVTTTALASSVGFMSITTLQIGLISAITVAGFVGWIAQAKTNRGVLSEFASLQRAQKETVSLRTENRELARVAADVEMLRVDPVELARMREELRTLQLPLRTGPRTQTNQQAAALPGEDSNLVVRGLRLPDADAETALSALELYTGRKIVRDSSLGRFPGAINIVSDRALTTGDIIRLLRTQLRERCGIIVEVTPDGTIVAKRALGK